MNSSMHCNYDRKQLTAGIYHIGVGNFHRSHQCVYIDDLIQKHQIYTWAIKGTGIILQDEQYNYLASQNYLYQLIEADSELIQVRTIGSLIEYVHGYEQSEKVILGLAHPNIKIVTITVTEAGYYINPSSKKLNLSHPLILNDLNGQRPKTLYGFLYLALKKRYESNVPPFTILTCDNMLRNGSTLKQGLLAFCRELQQYQIADWIEEKVTCPCSMVDRITVALAPAEKLKIKEDYLLHDLHPVLSETYKQWIIEDKFCNERPPLEKVGVQFTSDVTPYENLKLRLLNGSHSAIAYLGYLCGYETIDDILKQEDFKAYVRNLMDIEVTPLVKVPLGLDLEHYKTMIVARFANKEIKDNVLRVCLNGSVKIPLFVLPSIKEQIFNNGPIRRLTLCVASWFYFLDNYSYTNDQNNRIDPLQEPLTELIRQYKHAVKNILQLKFIFGDLDQTQYFVDELQSALDYLYKKGPRCALKHYI